MNVANSNHYYYVVFGLCWCGIHFNFLFKWLSYKKKVCYSDFLEKIEDWVMCVCVYIMHLGDQRESLTLSYIVLEDQSQHDIRDKEQH